MPDSRGVAAVDKARYKVAVAACIVVGTSVTGEIAQRECKQGFRAAVTDRVARRPRDTVCERRVDSIGGNRIHLAERIAHVGKVAEFQRKSRGVGTTRHAHDDTLGIQHFDRKGIARAVQTQRGLKTLRAGIPATHAGIAVTAPG